MAPKQTNHQLSSRLQYVAQTPSFLRKLQLQTGGRRHGSDEEEEPDPSFEDGDMERLDPNRPAIPRRPAIPVRPTDEPNGDDSAEDSGEERPTVVVLKEGKHLTSDEAINEKRKAKGLPPLPAKKEELAVDAPPPPRPSSSHTSASLSFSSARAKTKSSGAGSTKRKAVGDSSPSISQPGESAKKKPKKESKNLLSFTDE
ncbi:hypothetical protein BS47DRAFT_1390231 [Hydnum rufescens UP504]|uniref:DUF4604 domain-containing protein n=1 Tax=Hydnum rufescens UP504 TaxID=1448309 RepID=A0A9P6DVY6_9AGAM|nr:hypothetical protein BS47DRAFT_1390231 [Hydnum rufescens UP504]